MKSASSVRIRLLGALIAVLVISTANATAAGPYLRPGV